MESRSKSCEKYCFFHKNLNIRISIYDSLDDILRVICIYCSAYNFVVLISILYKDIASFFYLFMKKEILHALKKQHFIL